MGKIWVRDFPGGLDARRLPEATTGGVLIRGLDGHINRGREFEQRAAIVKAYDLPPDTKGLAATASGLFVFGSEPAPTLPAGVSYQRLIAASGAALERVLSVDLFAGKLLVAAAFADETVHNFYDAARITDWPAGASFATFIKTVARKAYGTAGPNLVFSAISDPMNNTTGAGAGFIDMSTQATGSETLTAIAPYQNFIAVFAPRTIQLEFVDPDPALNRLSQTLNNTGTSAPRSVTQFGDNDVFYLDSNGIRSLRAREAINVAFTSDTGNLVDDLVIALLESLTDEQRARAVGIIEPRDGRLWMAINDQIFVFSYFPGSKVSAWTIYRPGFVVDDMVTFNRRVFMRSGDTIHVYGSTDGAFSFAGVHSEAWLPFLDANAPTTSKAFQGFDAAVTGTWEVRVGLSPTQPDASDRVATVTQTTYEAERDAGLGSSTHISLRFQLIDPPASGPAKLSAVVIHHDLEDDT